MSDLISYINNVYHENHNFIPQILHYKIDGDRDHFIECMTCSRENIEVDGHRISIEYKNIDSVLVFLSIYSDDIVVKYTNIKISNISKEYKWDIKYMITTPIFHPLLEN